MTLAWKLVSKHLHPHEQLHAQIRRKIAKLELHLQHFPPEAVHLSVHLMRHPKTEVFTAALTLSLPSNTLRSEKSGKTNPISVFDLAVKALLRELAHLKGDLRHEQDWRRKGRRNGFGLQKSLSSAEASQPADSRPSAEAIALIVRNNVGRLLYHVQSQLQRNQVDGEIPKGAINSEAVVDEVVRQALSKPQKKPETLSYQMWLFSLARRELKRRYRQLRLDAQRNVPIEEMASVPDDDERVQGYDAELPLDILEHRIEPSIVSRGDLLADDHNPSPDAVAAEHDLIDYLHHATAGWPQQERAVFDLHFLEGFDAVEVALLENIKPPEAAELIGRVQSRLRALLSVAAGRWSQARVRAASA